MEEKKEEKVFRLATKIKSGEEEFDEIEVFPETAGTISSAVYMMGDNPGQGELARMVARTKIKGFDNLKNWNLKTARRLAFADYLILKTACEEFDKNFICEPVLILR